MGRLTPHHLPAALLLVIFVLCSRADSLANWVLLVGVGAVLGVVVYKNKTPTSVVSTGEGGKEEFAWRK